MNLSEISKIIESLSSYIDKSPFLVNFTSGLAILLIGGIVGRIFLPGFLMNMRRPKKLELFFDKTKNDTFMLTRETNNSYSYFINLTFCNLSNTSFMNDVHWHLWIPKNINPNPESTESSSSGITPSQRVEQDLGKTYIHFSGQFLQPIFAKQNRSFHYGFRGSFIDKKHNEPSEVITIYYKLATEFGVYPNKLKEDIKLGSIDLKTCGKLYFKKID